MTLPENSTPLPSFRVGEKLRDLGKWLEEAAQNAHHYNHETLCDHLLVAHEMAADVIRERDGTIHIDPFPPVEGYRLRVMIQMPDKRVCYLAWDDIPTEARLEEEIAGMMAVARDPENYFPINTFRERDQAILCEELRLRYLGFDSRLEIDSADAS